MQPDCSSWVRWLVNSNRSCADKLGGGWEKYELQRTTKRYVEDGPGEDVELRLLLLVLVILAARALPPHTNRRRRTKKGGTGRKYPRLCVMSGYGAPLFAFNLTIYQGAGCVLSFSVQPDSTMELC